MRMVRIGWGLVWLGTVGALLPLPGAAAQAAGILTQFQGGSLAQSSFVPPDMGGSVGAGYVVQLLNGVATIDTTAGANLSQTSLSTFFGQTGTLSDPRVIFDPASQRWFASAVTISASGTAAPNTVLVAVSKASNPTAGFTTLSFASTAGAFADFPTLGVNGAAVTIGTNDFSNISGANIGSSVYSIPKSALLTATPSLATMSSFIDTGNTGIAPQAVTNAAAGGASTTVLSVGVSGTTPVYALSTVSGANAPGASLALTALYDSTTIPSAAAIATALVAPTQPGGTAYDAGDTRISAGPYQAGNNIYFVNTVANATTGATANNIAWSVLNATTGTVAATGALSMPGLSLSYGAVAGNASGTFAIAFTGSGAGQNITDYYAICSLASGGCGAPQIAWVSAANNYNNAPGGANRWGDYSWVSLDPTNSANFWLFQQYAASNTGWATVITQVGTAVPEPGALLTLAVGVLGLGLARRRRLRG